jgi:cold shock CspA family protein
MSSEDRCTGVVKWFNNRAGYGFVTATTGDKEGSDIFAHHTSIQVGKEQYKYLVQGEYVEFTVSPTEEGVAHEYQASDIKGMNSGKLMCETRFENRRPRRPRRNDKDGEVEENLEEEVKKTKSRTNRGGGGPRENQTNSQRRPRNKGAKKAQEQEQEQDA